MLNINTDLFYDRVRSAFGTLSQSQVDGLNDLLLFIQSDDHPWPIPHVAYMLATTKWESANTYHPIKERGSKEYFERRYGHDCRVGKRLGNCNPGDGALYYGRGYCQITGRANYDKFSTLLLIDLINNPDQALVPRNAYNIMSIGMRKGLFTGRKLTDYDHPTYYDYTNARRIINGTDKAQEIASYAKAFESALS